MMTGMTNRERRAACRHEEVSTARARFFIVPTGPKK